MVLAAGILGGVYQSVGTPGPTAGMVYVVNRFTGSVYFCHGANCNYTTDPRATAEALVDKMEKEMNRSNSDPTKPN
jgi:hypothetical protein